MSNGVSESEISNDLEPSTSPKLSITDRIAQQPHGKGETGVFDTLKYIFSSFNTSDRENVPPSNNTKSLNSRAVYSKSSAYQPRVRDVHNSAAMDSEFKKSLLSTDSEENSYDDLSSGINPLMSSRDKKLPNRFAHDAFDEDTGIELANLDGDHIEKQDLGSREPPDVKNFGYYLFVLQGIGMLFPWNCFINAGQYFKKKLEKTSYTDYIENYFELTFQLSHLVMLFISVYYQHLIPLRVRTIQPLILQAIVFVILLILVFIPGSDAMFWFIIVLSLIAGGATSIFQSGMFGLSGMLPPRYTQAIMVGQASGAIKVSLMFIIFLKSLHDPMMTGLAFFIMAVAMICVCLWGCIKVFDQPIVRYYIRASERDDEYRSQGERVRPDFRGIIKRIWIVAVAVILTYGLTLSIFPGLADAVRGSDYWYANNDDCATCDIHFKCLKGSSISKTSSDKKVVDAYLSPLSASVHETEDDGAASEMYFSERNNQSSTDEYGESEQFIGRMLLESDNDRICSDAKEKCESCNAESLWLPVYCFLTFNVGDLIGRTIVGKYQFVGPNNLIWPVLVRLLFIPVFMTCNIKPTYLAVLFKSDFWPFFFMFLMAVSNGSLGSLCMMYGPGLVDQKDKETAGTLMITALTIGLNSGSFFSFLLKWIATREVPL